ncbi:hypothetical protein PUN28_011867 [Cardiocondyla obscurior]|uniref:Uncharacterized protein n=1 Tax=Cardiocondyla obscurior TaxID=286306 RepID=A0AAW2FLM7_9HYME
MYNAQKFVSKRHSRRIIANSTEISLVGCLNLDKTSSNFSSNNYNTYNSFRTLYK